MTTHNIPASLFPILVAFQQSFHCTATAENFAILATAWILCSERHSIARVLQAAKGSARDKAHSSFYRFFSESPWIADQLSRSLFELFLPFLPEVILAPIDDTLAHRSGPHLFGAAMHYDAARSTYGRGSSKRRTVAFAFGHNWVILALWIPIPFCHAGGLAIPLLFRLYVSEKRCPKNRTFRKRTLLALELIRVLKSWLPKGRKLHVVGDSEYSCETIVKGLPAGVEFTGPLGMDAALFSLPKLNKGRGRPAKKGKRLPNPAQLAASEETPWSALVIPMYGRETTVLVKTLTCLWYKVAGDRLVRIVVTRDPTGRIEDR